MRTRTHTWLVVPALLAIAAVPARSQETAVDSRWLAYLGCWEPIESAKSHVCVVPAAGASAVQLVTIVKGEVETRERIATSGERFEATRGECHGWHSAEWSARGARVYVRSTETCAEGTSHTGTGVIAMAGDGSQWFYVQGMTLAGRTGVRVQRYRAVTDDILLPDDIRDALRPDVVPTMQARAVAAAPLAIDDVIEASPRLDAAVLEAWLIERAEPFTLDAKRLVALADAGVPPSIIDLMVALSYPKVFAINAALRQGERRPTLSGGARGAGPVSAYSLMNPFCSSLYFPYSAYDCLGLGYGRGFGYGYDWYPGRYPVTIVYVGSGSSRPHGRVVNGRGYTRGRDSAGGNAIPRSAEPRSRSSSGAASGTGSKPSASSSSGSGEQRTAKPRPH